MKTIKLSNNRWQRLICRLLRKIRDPVAKAKIASRVNRMASACFGDHKPCRESIWELQIDQSCGLSRLL